MSAGGDRELLLWVLRMALIRYSRTKGYRAESVIMSCGWDLLPKDVGDGFPAAFREWIISDRGTVTGFLPVVEGEILCRTR